MCYVTCNESNGLQREGLSVLFLLPGRGMHVHVKGADGDAKFWLEPEVELAMQHGLPPHRVSEIRRLVEEHQDEIRDAWQRHIGS